MPKYDLLVIGGGPAGSSAAYWGAKRGLSVAVLEKKNFPRDKTCGDGLTPRAVLQLEEMGVLTDLEPTSHRHIGLRTRANQQVLELEWPDHPDFPNYGLCVRRREFDQLLLQAAEKQGAKVFMQTEAVEPIFTANKLGLAGAKIKSSIKTDFSEISARSVIVSDGANSRFGRALGAKRERSWPQGMAIRTYYESVNSSDVWLESNIDIRDKNGGALPGYGWVFPLGDGTINVGIGILSTSKNYTDLNTSKLMTQWANAVDDRWNIDSENPCIDPVGGRLPMGGSVSPKAGTNWMLVGDAAGFINPFNGEGIDYALETGRHSANLIVDNLTKNSDPDFRHVYPEWLEKNYGLYFRIGRAFAKIIGKPAIMKNLTGTGMRSKSLMEWALRIMSNMLRPEERGPAELAYNTIATLLKIKDTGVSKKEGRA